MQKPQLLVVGPPPGALSALDSAFQVSQVDAQVAVSPDLAAQVQAIALMSGAADRRFMAQFPSLKIIACFGVGYDHVDAQCAASRDIIVTNTPDVLDEEVADTALGLLLCTVRQLPQAMAYLKAGLWARAPYPASRATLRNRTVGLVGMGRIGQAIARRLDAFAVPVVYHARHRNTEVPYRHYADLLAMAADVDTLLVVVPGGPATRHLINGPVLDALGADGILINIARGSVVDQPLLIKALTERRILAAGLDVYDDEPNVPETLIRLDNVVLLPHVGSASVYTRGRMQRLVVDNLLAWVSGKGPLTPVAECRSIVGHRQ